MRLHYAPGACSLGIHIILEEIGVGYELALVDLRRREQVSPTFLALNPKGKVPALSRDDGSVLTEFPAIAFWLAETFPTAGLIAPDTEGRIRTLELIDFVVATVHMRGFTLARLPQKFTGDPQGRDDVAAAGRRVAEDGLAALSAGLGEAEWFLGSYSIADAAVFYVLNWAIGDGWQVPPNLVAFHARMLRRPAVAAALRQEGLA